jgi:hypothetical protein
MQGIVMMAKRLAEEGYKLALEFREGRRDHVSSSNEKPAAAYVPLISELKRRCPGYHDDDYSRAIADGLFNSR